ncbi:MAG: HPr family phosphocarrier protein [Pseudomonadales bacterium]|jgi:phosphocarrier protein|nr:HPr family phosphocarrier protein [Pseudomonadales bacterium]MDP6470841.1 HPr family phosphocarrier protein [Pseudomonadales bacterium]MDP6825974.1 HPr family phosphocarrier protein [Pseudomonadales bacterium]MDP6972286.1 HPr family phosphocarrier protein [Pseudomonadales bacterium]|tara:strand:- start:198 stop:467 length:270 start_codon:yes stop_codon:yes gene_type:complete
MRQARVKLVNRLGLHARAASKLVNLTKTFESKIQLTHEGQAIDAKSIMSVLMLAAPVGTELDLGVTGSDEDAACLAVVELVNDRFGEDE